jgi:hypothetical protein
MFSVFFTLHNIWPMFMSSGFVLKCWTVLFLHLTPEITFCQLELQEDCLHYCRQAPSELVAVLSEQIGERIHDY